MIRVISRLTFAAVLLASCSLRADPNPSNCKLTWNYASPAAGETQFHLDKSIDITPYPHTQVSVSVIAMKKRSKWIITQSYGPSDRDFFRYEIQCDQGLNCSGSRTKSFKGQLNKTPFVFAPSPQAIAKIGNRIIFKYEPTHTGFAYQFIDYELDNKTVGMELSCDE